MSLHLVDTCTLIAGLTVTNGTDTVTIDDIDEVERGYESANLPRLLVLPSDDEGGVDTAVIGIDTSSVVTWNITALYLEAPAEEGFGWKQHAEKVATFVENFIQALVDAKASFCANETMFLGVSPRRGVYEYPRASGRWYYGAMFVIRVKDFTRIT